MLLEPRNAHYHCRLAESLYSQGEEERALHARKHFAISLTHQAAPLNVRALCGLVAACRRVEEQKSGVDEHEKRVNAELLRWAKEQAADVVQKDAQNTALALLLETVMGM